MEQQQSIASLCKKQAIQQQKQQRYYSSSFQQSDSLSQDEMSLDDLKVLLESFDFANLREIRFKFDQQTSLNCIFMYGVAQNDKKANEKSKCQKNLIQINQNKQIYQQNHNNKIDASKINRKQFSTHQLNSTMLFDYVFTQKLNELTKIEITSDRSLRYSNYKNIEIPQLKAHNLSIFSLNIITIYNLDQFSQGFYPELKEIQLTVCRGLTSLPKFNTPKLQKIHLKYCIQDINQFCEGFYPELKRVNFQYISFSISKIGIFISPKLEQLNLHLGFQCDYFIKQFSQQNYPCLKYLKICSQKIKQLPSLLYCPKLQILQLKKNSIQNAEKFCKGNFLNLKVLNLSQNNLLTVNSIRAPLLQKIDFSYNKIFSLDQFFQLDYPHLNEANFLSNKIPKLPLIKAKLLQILIIQCNLISNLDQFFAGQYPNLKNINLKNNKLVILPKIAINMPNLTVLIIQLNQISCIEQFANSNQFQNLNQLNLNNNKLIKLPLINAKNLKILMVSNNIIQKTDQFCSNKQINLQNLIINENLLRDIPLIYPNVLDMKKLVQIDLQRNLISNIQLLGFINFQVITTISLEKNQISSIKIFQKLKLPLINQINMKHNCVSSYNSLQRAQLKICFKKNEIAMLFQMDTLDDWRPMYKLHSNNFQNLELSLTHKNNQIQSLKLRKANMRRWKYFHLIYKKQQ